MVASEENMAQVTEEICSSIPEGDANGVKTKVEAALAACLDPATILNDGMISAMGEVDRRCEVGEYYVPEVLIVARVMKAGLAILKPHLVQADVNPIAKVVIVTAGGDLHDSGKNLVGIYARGRRLRGARFRHRRGPRTICRARSGRWGRSRLPFGITDHHDDEHEHYHPGSQ